MQYEPYLLHLLAGIEDGPVVVREGTEDELAEMAVLLQPLDTPVLLHAGLRPSLRSLVAELVATDRHGKKLEEEI